MTIIVYCILCPVTETVSIYRDPNWVKTLPPSHPMKDTVSSRKTFCLKKKSGDGKCDNRR
jgi:hypothetical protein